MPDLPSGAAGEGMGKGIGVGGWGDKAVVERLPKKLLFLGEGEMPVLRPAPWPTGAIHGGGVAGEIATARRFEDEKRDNREGKSQLSRGHVEEGLLPILVIVRGLTSFLTVEAFLSSNLDHDICDMMVLRDN